MARSVKSSPATRVRPVSGIWSERAESMDAKSGAISPASGRHDLAMTSEITLRRRVLPIEGVKEKVLGAVRAGIRTVVLPKENAPDLEDLPEDVRSWLDVHLVEDLDEVLTLALRGARFEAGHLVFDGDAPIEPSLIAKHN